MRKYLLHEKKCEREREKVTDGEEVKKGRNEKNTIS